ncbi:MAG: hypothetical protein ACYDCG_16815 [Candidatus Acidiferrales bacterium]
MAIPVLAAALCGGLAAADKLSELQTRFDSETNAVHKAKMLHKLGDAEFEEAGRAAHAGDFATMGLIIEKYRDNVRAASLALEKENPDAERHPNGYKQLEMDLQKGLRELDEFLLEAPEPFKPPLQLVRQDLINADDKLLHGLFPPHHKPKQEATPPPAAPPGLGALP